MSSTQTRGIWHWWPAEVDLPSPVSPGRNNQTGRLLAATSSLVPDSWLHWRCSGSQEIHLTQSKVSSSQKVISCLCAHPRALATAFLGNNCVAALRSSARALLLCDRGCWVQRVIKCLPSKSSSVFGCLEEKQACGTWAKLIHFLIPELI